MFNGIHVIPSVEVTIQFPGPTATNRPAPNATSVRVTCRLVRVVQSSPFTEDEMIPRSPTATNVPPPYVTPTRWFSPGAVVNANASGFAGYVKAILELSPTATNCPPPRVASANTTSAGISILNSDQSAPLEETAHS